ncbi:hypothetical protein [Shinella sp. BYT-45]|uniref:hypothetical protein n=1 Tax=Shinella sp. BYT-45 TaxID=3377377 RepID=UPI00397EA6E9
MIALLNRAALPAVAAAALLLTFALVVLLIVSRIDTLVDRAVTLAVAGRDAHWTAEIERANAETNKRIADQAQAALAIETEANARVRAVEAQLSELETANAALPAGDACGLGRDRIRLLPR